MSNHAFFKPFAERKPRPRSVDRWLSSSAGGPEARRPAPRAVARPRPPGADGGAGGAALCGNEPVERPADQRLGPITRQLWPRALPRGAAPRRRRMLLAALITWSIPALFFLPPQWRAVLLLLLIAAGLVAASVAGFRAMGPEGRTDEGPR